MLPFSGIFLLSSLFVRLSFQGGQFMGGSISFTLHNGTGDHVVANVEMFTNWVLGTGPCGSTCSKADIGTSTNTKRASARYGDHNFGNFSTDFPIVDSYNPDDTGNITSRSIQTFVMQNYTEIVWAMSEKDKWEQDLMKFSFELKPNKGREDFNIQGYPWRPLTIQGNSILWHMQVRIRPQIRSDTNTRNECPVTLTKAIYRIKFNQTSTLHIPVIDKDGDFVKCFMSSFKESGELHRISPKGVIVNQDCKIEIEATPANGYSDNSWIAIPVSIRDQNRLKIQFGPVTWNPAPPVEYLSTCSMQIAVLVKQSLHSPVFIDPTPAPNHKFVVYTESLWKTTIYAKAISPRRIKRFETFGRNAKTIFNMSPVNNTSDPSVSYVEISWRPSNNDVDDQITCITAFDDSGDESDEQRCFLLTVQYNIFNTATKSSMGIPHFVDLPASDKQVVCPVEASCVVPIFIKSYSNIGRVWVTEGTIDYKFGKIENITKAGEHLFETTLTITSDLHGDHNLCLQAVTVEGVASETTCIKFTVKPKDPCYSSPCDFGGLCQLRNDSSGLFDCECIDGYSGPTCAKALDVCHPNPCLHGDCFSSVKPFFCYCIDDHALPNDFSGDSCEQRIDNCKGVTCSHHGVCVDGHNTHSCQCFSGYKGQNCETADGHAGQSNAACTTGCQNHGVCITGSCRCGMGYTGRQCETGAGDISTTVQGVSFVQPTVNSGSKYACATDDEDRIKNCTVILYMASENGIAPTLSILTTDGLTETSAGPVEEQQVVTGISKLFTSIVHVEGTVSYKSGHYICFVISDKTEHSTSEICIELEFETYKGSTTMPSSFIAPTLLPETRLICYTNESCRIFLYTSLNGSGCEQVTSATKGVTVFETLSHAGTSVCLTEISYNPTHTNDTAMCFLATQEATSDKRCFAVSVFETGKDPCGRKGSTVHGSCQNKGLCFMEDRNTDKCICQPGNTGDECEKGLCTAEKNNCMNDGYCLLDGQRTNCICRAGYEGDNCDQVAVSTLNESSIGGAKFDFFAKPVSISCNKNRACGLYASMIGKIDHESPLVELGFVSQQLQIVSMETKPIPKATGGYQTTVTFLPRKVGEYNVCLQTLNNYRINKDEVCFNVTVTDGVDLVYNKNDLPHFIQPSLQPNSDVQCIVDDVCHVTYSYTPGDVHENECIKVDLVNKMSSDFENKHAFSTCENCVDGTTTNQSCTLDVAFRPSSADHNRKLCVALSLAKGGQVGEERCFTMLVSNVASTPKAGCQGVQCYNGGFCDGHVPSRPVCYCREGFSGHNCLQAYQSCVEGFPRSSVQDIVYCQKGKQCMFPFKFCAKNGQQAKIIIGYKDPCLFIGQPTYFNMNGTYDCHCSFGSVKLSPSIKAENTTQFCLQIFNSSGLVKDEVCPKVILSEIARENAIESEKPFFLSPYLKEVDCVKGADCHFDIRYTDGAKFKTSLPCPTLSISKYMANVHIFPANHHDLGCVSDVSYKVPSTANVGDKQTLCLRLSLPRVYGEEHCITINIKNTLRSSQVDGPCRNSNCRHGALCIANTALDTYQCICQDGFKGSNCHENLPSSGFLPGVENMNASLVIDGPRFHISRGVLNKTSCFENEKCTVVIPYFGKKNDRPIKRYCNTTITEQPGTQVITNVTETSDLQLLFSTFLESSGTELCCYQTTVDVSEYGMNVDEFCFVVEVSPRKGGNIQVNSGSQVARFISPAMGTRYICKSNDNCYISVITEKNQLCDQVIHCCNGGDDIHIFATKELNDVCVTELVVHTKNEGQEQSICTKVGISGPNVTFTVLALTPAGFGPCQKLHCEHGGTCVTGNGAAVCYCIPGYTGVTCEIDIDDCVSNPCFHNGTCVDHVNGYTCVCTEDYGGIVCQTDGDCAIGSAPEKLICNSLPCSIVYTVHGSLIAPVVSGAPQTVTTQTTAHTFNDVQRHFVSIELTESIDLCHTTSVYGKHGNCSRTQCTSVVYNDKLKRTDAFYNCSSKSLGNNIPHVLKIEKGLNDICPSLSESKETTMFDYEIMVNDKVEDTVCFATVSGFENVTNGTLCLRDYYGVVKCMSCITGCTHKKSNEQASSTVPAGYINCFCFTDSGEKIYIIMKRPVSKTVSLAMAAGYGAISMIGAIAIGTAIIIALKKLVSKTKKNTINTTDE